MAKSVNTIVLRVLAAVSFLVSSIVMFVSSQKVKNEYINFTFTYIQWNGFLFCVTVNCIGCVYNLLVVAIPHGSQLWKTVIVLDVIVNVLVGASLGAGWQTYILIRQGQMQQQATRWCALCGTIAPFFCSKILGSLISSTLGFAFSILLLMYTLHVCVDPLLLSNH